MQSGTGYGAVNILTPSEALAGAADAQSRVNRSQLEQATMPDEIAMSAIKRTASELALADAKSNSLVKNTGNSQALIANALSLATTHDEADKALRALADAGVSDAAQYIGRWTTENRDRWVQALSAAAPTSALAAMNGQGPAVGGGSQLTQAGGAAPGGQFAQQFAHLTPAQLTESFGRLEGFRHAIDAVRQSANPAAEWDKQAQALGQPDSVGKYSPDELARLSSEIIPIDNYLRGRMTREGLGIPEVRAPAETKEVGGVLYERNPTSGDWVAKTPRISTLSGDQQLVEVLPGGEPVPAAPDGGVALADWSKKMQGSENATGDPAAKNPRSSAAGNGQFLGRLDAKGHGSGTWFDVVKEDPQFAADIRGKTDAQILALRADPKIADRAVQSLAVSNATALKASDHPVNGTTLALAHRFGMADAKDILDASPDTPISALVTPSVMRANPDLMDKATNRPKTAGEVARGLAAQFGTNPVAVPGLAGAQSAPSGVPGVRILASGVVAADGQEPLSDKAIEYIAERYVGTGVLPAMGMGKAATANRNAVFNKASEIEQATGQTGADAIARWATVKADTHALQGLSRQAAMINAFEQTAVKNADQVLLLAPKGVGGSAPVLNRWINAGRRQIAGDADVSKFNLAVGTLADEYAKVVSGGTGSTAVTDSARAEAYSRINGAMTVNQLQNVIAQMKIEMENRRSSLSEEQANLTNKIRGGGAPVAKEAAAPVATSGAPKPAGVAFRDGYPVFTPEQAKRAAGVPGNQGKKFYTADGQIRTFN